MVEYRLIRRGVSGRDEGDEMKEWNFSNVKYLVVVLARLNAGRRGWTATEVVLELELEDNDLSRRLGRFS